MTRGPGSADVRAIDIAIIKTGQRLRPVDEAQVALIAESFAAIGQEQPITVNFAGLVGPPDFPDAAELVIGAHRLAAARRLGWTSILARLVCVDRDTARLMEIDENLTRVELSALDRCLALAERKRVYERLRGTRGPGRPKKNGNHDSHFCGFAAGVAESVGLGKRAINQAVQIASALSPEAISGCRRQCRRVPSWSPSVAAGAGRSCSRRPGAL